MRGFQVAGVRGASSLRTEVRGEGGRQQGRRPPWPLSQGLECLAEELDLYFGSQSVLPAALSSLGETLSVFSGSLRRFCFTGPISLFP